MIELPRIFQEYLILDFFLFMKHIKTHKIYEIHFETCWKKYVYITKHWKDLTILVTVEYLTVHFRIYLEKIIA